MLLVCYRLALVANLCLLGVGFSNPSWLEPALPESVRAYLESTPEPGAALLGVMFLALLCYVAGCVGALWFWRPSRHLFASSVIAMILLNPALGPSIDPGWKDLLEEAGTLLDGMLVCAMFASPLRDRFGASAA